MCNGICTRYKAQKPYGISRYASGQRRCQHCEIFLKYEGFWCPCCRSRLRTKPRNLKYKTALQQTSIKVGEPIVLKGIQYVLVNFVSSHQNSQKWLVKNQKTGKIVERVINQ
jgi:uncharacterized paraquat-inducible protein A